MSDLCNAIKLLAQEAVSSQKPLEVCFGRVIKESPLKIQTEQKLILTEEFLTVSESLKEKTVTAHFDDRAVEMKLKDGLKEGDSVIMLRQQGGQSYVVIDREG